MRQLRILLRDQKSLKICCHPVDYIMWIVLWKRVYCTKISNVDELKRRIDSEWAALRHTVIEPSGVSICALAFVMEADILSTCDTIFEMT